MPKQSFLLGLTFFTCNNLRYKFTTIQAIPVGGQVFINSWETEGYIPTKITTYEADRITIIESGLNVTTTDDIATLILVNNHQRCRYGSNNYKESDIRQWLNSNADTFVWTPKTNYDRPATYKTKGFLKLLDSELADVIGTVDKQTGRNTVTDGGGQDTFSDKIFFIVTGRSLWRYI